MKRILCVAVLLGLTTALHAAEYKWDKDSNSFKSGDTTLGAHTNVKTLALSITYAGLASDIKHDFFAIRQRNANGAPIDIIKFGIESAGNSSEVRSVYVIAGKTANGTNPTIFSEENFGQGAKLQTALVTAEMENGILYPIVSYTDGSRLLDGPLTLGKLDFDGLSFDYLEVFEGTEVYEATLVIDGTPVPRTDPTPEPGVLGLLALGVAGLALRRRRVA